ncbi:hypothetical protein [Dyella sp.]
MTAAAHDSLACRLVGMLLKLNRWFDKIIGLWVNTRCSRLDV